MIVSIQFQILLDSLLVFFAEELYCDLARAEEDSLFIALAVHSWTLQALIPVVKETCDDCIVLLFTVGLDGDMGKAEPVVDVVRSGDHVGAGHELDTAVIKFDHIVVLTGPGVDLGAAGILGSEVIEIEFCKLLIVFNEKSDMIEVVLVSVTAGRCLDGEVSAFTKNDAFLTSEAVYSRTGEEDVSVVGQALYGLFIVLIRTDADCAVVIAEAGMHSHGLLADVVLVHQFDPHALIEADHALGLSGYGISCGLAFFAVIVLNKEFCTLVDVLDIKCHVI